MVRTQGGCGTFRAMSFETNPPGMVARLRSLSRNVYALGVVSFLTDLASEMLYPLIQVFVTVTLGTTPAILGLIEGIAEGGSSILRWLTGAFSDRFRRRKPFVVAGYSISAISKPIMGLAACALGWPLFFAGRALDRLGKSVRTSARDALIADSVPADRRGLAFGLHRAMDTAGAVVGPLIAFLVLTCWENFPLQYLFFLALIPGVLSAIVAGVGTRDIPHEPSPSAKPPPLFQSYPRALWWLIAAVALFSFGNSSDQFLMLRSKDLGLTLPQIVLAFVLYNAVYTLAALPLGHLSDKIGRRPVVAAGWIVYALVYVGFATVTSSTGPWLLFPVYGLYQALTEGVSKALVADTVSKDQRAGAIGLFYTVAGFGQLFGSILAGLLWKLRIGPLHAPFAVGAICALAAVPLLFVRPGDKTAS